MRILFLSLTLPVPANNGAKMRTWAVLRALAAEGHEITLLSFAQDDKVNGANDGETVVSEVCRNIELVPLRLTNLSTTGDYSRRLAALFSTLPYGVVRFCSENMKARIRNWIDSQQVDVVLCDTPYSVINLPAVPSVPLIVNGHNVEHIILHRYVAFEQNLAKKGYAWLEMRKLRRWEQRACSRASMVMVCSEVDRVVMRRLCPKTSVMVIPNIVDTETYVPNGEPDSKTVLFQGGMDWYPNRDAVDFFIAEILPALRMLVPDARFVVAGRDPGEVFRRRFLGVAGVEFTGTVPDMRTEIVRASVCVVPLRIASGTRLKILEAGAMAKPIVSTRVGAEGLEFTDRKEIMLADEPLTFAKAVAELITDPLRRQILGQTARRRVEQQYSFPFLRAALREALTQFVERP